MSRDAQRSAVYRWEGSLGLPQDELLVLTAPAEPPAAFFDFYRRVWRFAAEGHPFLDPSHPPPVEFSKRMKRVVGTTALVHGRLGIRLAYPEGLRRAVALHEIAHILTMPEGHSAKFCRVALELYMHAFGIAETAALAIAKTHGVKVASLPGTAELAA